MRITKILLTLVLLFICSIYALKAQSPNCKKFRNGTFKMVYLKSNAIIKRNGNKQDEYINGSKSPTLSFTVKWVDDCTYTLTPDLLTLKKNPNIPKGSFMVVKITKTTNNSYFTTAYFNTDQKTTFKSELVLVK